MHEEKTEGECEEDDEDVKPTTDADEEDTQVLEEEEATAEEEDKEAAEEERRELSVELIEGEIGVAAFVGFGDVKSGEGEREAEEWNKILSPLFVSLLIIPPFPLPSLPSLQLSSVQVLLILTASSCFLQPLLLLLLLLLTGKVSTGKGKG